MKTATKKNKKKQEKKISKKSKNKNNDYIFLSIVCTYIHFGIFFLSLPTISIIAMFLVFIVIYSKQRIN